MSIAKHTLRSLSWTVSHQWSERGAPYKGFATTRRVFHYSITAPTVFDQPTQNSSALGCGYSTFIPLFSLQMRSLRLSLGRLAVISTVLDDHGGRSWSGYIHVTFSTSRSVRRLCHNQTQQCHLPRQGYALDSISQGLPKIYKRYRRSSGRLSRYDSRLLRRAAVGAWSRQFLLRTEAQAQADSSDK